MADPMERLMEASLQMENFGRNLTWTPSQIFEPRDEPEVLSILERYRGRQIRVVGRLHSWSPVVVAEDIVISLWHLDRVVTENRNGRVWIQVQAGCQVKTVLDEIEKQAGVTLPTIGLITEQTFVGAAATATHGSGNNSLSHYIEETFRRHRSLDSVLVAAEQFPLQQFYLIPWLWEFIAQHRREVNAPRSRLARLYRWYFYIVFDVTFHLVVSLLIRSGRRRLVHGFFHRVLPWTVLKNWQVVDKSQDILVMKHDLFRHIEMELFVAQSQIHDALAYVEAVLRFLDGDTTGLNTATQERLAATGQLEILSQLRGRYTHHYPICVRRVLADDAMLAMSSGTAEPWYAISFISYDGPEDHSKFLRMAEFLAQSMVTLFAARPHWGKICPFTPEQAEHSYSELTAFRAVVAEFDPQGVFRNDWVQRLIFRGANSEAASARIRVDNERQNSV